MIDQDESMSAGKGVQDLSNISKFWKATEIMGKRKRLWYQNYSSRLRVLGISIPSKKSQKKLKNQVILKTKLKSIFFPIHIPCRGVTSRSVTKSKLELITTNQSFSSEDNPTSSEHEVVIVVDDNIPNELIDHIEIDNATDDQTMLNGLQLKPNYESLLHLVCRLVLSLMLLIAIVICHMQTRLS